MQRHFSAVEPEEFQAIGMQLRETMISFIDAVREDIDFPLEVDQPQAANFGAWSELILNHLCSGSRNKQLRQYLKKIAVETWRLVKWLTHHRNANKTATGIELHACDTLYGHFIKIITRDRSDHLRNVLCTPPGTCRGIMILLLNRTATTTTHAVFVVGAIIQT